MTTETTDGLPGTAKTTKSQVLEAGASAIQDFTPVKHICAHLNAFHVYASDKTRCVEANHYCSHITEGIPSLPPPFIPKHIHTHTPRLNIYRSKTMPPL